MTNIQFEYRFEKKKNTENAVIDVESYRFHFVITKNRDNILFVTFRKHLLIKRNVYFFFTYTFSINKSKQSTYSALNVSLIVSDIKMIDFNKTVCFYLLYKC